jgi:hypothetical protein
MCVKIRIFGCVYINIYVYVRIYIHTYKYDIHKQGLLSTVLSELTERAAARFVRRVLNPSSPSSDRKVSSSILTPAII